MDRARNERDEVVVEGEDVDEGEGRGEAEGVG